MAKYRKKPAVIEAFQLKDADFVILQILEWINPKDKQLATDDGYRFRVADKVQSDKGIIITTLEGDMKANFGDYIIKGVNGEFYPCKPDIFEKTYEAVI